MMSSAIPARLEYQCGHAALVSLPRIKGETSAQRTRRVALEKSAALARQCDFCAPVVEVAPVQLPEPVAVGVELPVASVVLETVVDGVDAVDGVDGQQVNGAEPVVAPPEEEEPAAPVLPSVKPKATRRTRARTRQATRDLRQFLVEYRVQRLVQAVDVRDALRQVATLGATDVLEIARQD
jgi:hypothetical protein